MFLIDIIFFPVILLLAIIFRIFNAALNLDNISIVIREVQGTKVIQIKAVNGLPNKL